MQIPRRTSPPLQAGVWHAEVASGPNHPKAPAAETVAPLRHIPELDGLRGIAATMVFFHHACFTTVHGRGWPLPIELLRRVSVYGANGVELFFVLSGFLITSILLSDRAKPSYYAPFYWKRVLRIVPVYVVMLLYVALSVPHTRLQMLCAVLFVANFTWFFHLPPLMPFWTLAIEEQFYLLWPTLVHRQRLAILARWAVSIGGGSVALRLTFAYFGHYNYYFTFLHCDGLAWGALLACLRGETEAVRWHPKWVIAGAFVLACALFGVNYFLPVTSLPWVACNAALAMTGISLLSLSIVGVLVFRSGRWWLGIFRSRTLIFFGLISYAFYMVHLYVIRAYDLRWPTPVAPQVQAYSVRFFVTFAGSVAIATVSRYLLELPVTRLRRLIPALRRPTHPAAGVDGFQLPGANSLVD